MMSNLKLYFLGAPRVEWDGQPIAISRKKAVALLTYLAITGRNHYRDWLVGLLWPEIAAGRTQLRIGLSSLRKALGKQWLVTPNGKIGLSPNIWVDVNHFRSLVDQLGKLPVHAPQRDTLLDEALGLYEYDFLAGFALRNAPEFEQWQRIEEENLRNVFERLLHERINRLLMQRDFESAQIFMSRLIQVDPYNEYARRQMMSLYVWTDQRQQALKSYEDFATLLQDYMGMEPEAETRALYHNIQQSVDIPKVPLPGMPITRERSYQLPVPDPLIGRQHEVSTILDSLKKGSRLLTIIGPSGIGKTHLALHVASHVKNQFQDGSYFIQVDTDVSAKFLESTLLDALNLHTADLEDASALLRNSLVNQNVLFIIDDFHRVTHGVHFIQDILHVAPHVTFLLTSYDQLTLNNEHCFPLRGLSNSTQSNQDESTQAVELFVHRARFVQPDFELTPTNADAINRICQLLEGIPLGIILAAAWCDVLTPQAVAHEIETNYDFLRVNHRDLPERHRSIRALFDSTWMQQSATEQRALMHLAVFQGGFSYDAAQTVAAVTLSTIKRLTAKSIIFYDAARNRYFIHDLLRQYALDKIRNRRDMDAIYRAYDHFFIDLVANAEAAIKGDLQNGAWDLIDADLANIRAAWQNTLQTRKFEYLLPMIEPLRLYLQARGLWDQGRILFEEARQRTRDQATDSARQVYLKTVSRLYTRDDHTPTTLEEAHKSAEQFHEQAEIAHIQAEQGWYWLEEGDYLRANDHFEAALAYYTASNDYYYGALVWRGLAYVTAGLGDRDRAMHCMRQSLAQRRAIGDWVGEHETLILRGEFLLLQGFVAAAAPDLETAFDFFATNFSEQAALYRCIGLAWAYVFMAEFDEALDFAAQLLNLAPARVMSPARGTGIAVAALVYGLQGDRPNLLHYTEELVILLASPFQWPTKANPDLIFFLKFASGVTHYLLGHIEEAAAVVRELSPTPTYQSASHLAWISPLVLLLVADTDDLAADLTAVLRSSEIATLPWIRYWDAAQKRLARLSTPNLANQPHDTEALWTRIAHLVSLDGETTGHHASTSEYTAS